VSADVMKSMGGSLQIDSKPGEGTTVRLYVPVRHDASTDQPREIAHAHN